MFKLQGSKVHDLIRARGYQSDTEFANRNGFTQSTLAGWISGRRGIKREQLEKLARILFVPPRDICTETDRKLYQLDEDMKRIRTLFGEMTDEQREAVLIYADDLLSGRSMVDRE